MSSRPDRASTPDERRQEMEHRMRRIRRVGIAGTLAALGAFSGLAAAGDRDRTSGPSAAAPSGTTVIAPQAGDGDGQAYPGDGSVYGYPDPSAEDDYFGSTPGSGVGPGSWGGPPDAFSGAS
jgi:hypothetical protein